MKKELLHTNWSSIFNAVGINDAVNNFSSIVNEKFTNHAPFINKQVNGKPSPWLNKETKTQMNNRPSKGSLDEGCKGAPDWKILA